MSEGGLSEAARLSAQQAHSNGAGKTGIQNFFGNFGGYTAQGLQLNHMIGFANSVIPKFPSLALSPLGIKGSPIKPSNVGVFGSRGGGGMGMEA